MKKVSRRADEYPKKLEITVDVHAREGRNGGGDLPAEEVVGNGEEDHELVLATMKNKTSGPSNHKESKVNREELVKHVVEHRSGVVRETVDRRIGA